MNDSPAQADKKEGASNRGRIAGLAGAIFLLAIIPRLMGLTWGLPNAGRYYSYHPDESPWQIVGAVYRMVASGSFDPHFFNYPSLTIYATYFLYLTLSGFGFATPGHGTWQASHDIILAGRMFSAICGAGTAVVTFLLARRLSSEKAAVFAGICAALAPGLLQHSHFATVDVPATFLVSWCLLLTARAAEPRQLLAAAAMAGLAAGAKYNAAIALAAPLVALWLMPATLVRKIGWSLGFVALAVIVFFVTTPYAFLNFPEFWGRGQNGFAYELLRHPHEGSGDLFTNTGNGWWYHFSFNLPFAATWPLLLCGLAGLAISRRDRRLWPAAAFVVLFFGSLGLSQVRFMRYDLPLVPVLCVGVGLLVSSIQLPKYMRWGAGIGVLLVLLGSVADVMVPLLGTDPRDEAAGVLRGQRVAISGNAWYFTPPFQPAGNNRPIPGVPSVGTDVAALRSLRPVAFVISEYEWREPLRNEPGGAMSKFLGELQSEVTAGRAEEQSFGGRTHMPFGLQRAYTPTDYRYTNPEVRIYRLR